jgi:crossover junction endodeoxyribonuclease RuvC
MQDAMEKTMTDIIMGIDPGVSGAIAFYDRHAKTIAAHDAPIANGEIDCDALARIIREVGPSLCIIEHVHAVSGNGVTSSFNFGKSYGMARGVVAACGVRIQLVSPSVWKRHYRLKADKEESRGLAILTWPGVNLFGRKKDHGRAEAALLAKYGADLTSA